LTPLFLLITKEVVRMNKVTSLRIDPELIRRVKILCVMKGVTMVAFIKEAIENHLSMAIKEEGSLFNRKKNANEPIKK